MPPLEIVTIDATPLELIPYFTTAAANTEPSEHQLPIYSGTVRGLPPAISSLVITSDLQGVVSVGSGAAVLLGEAVVEYLDLVYSIHFPSFPKGEALVLLCGDLYANPAKRGESGNPFRVWEAFSAAFACTIGIAGNHDDFGSDLGRVQSLDRTHFLTQGTALAQGLSVAGLSGIIGRRDKNFRLAEDAYLKGVTALLRQAPHVLLTHLSPRIDAKGLPGEAQLTALLTKGPRTLVLCGHSHWPTVEPQVLANGTQVLNADSKVFILTRA
jgi:Icc protein